MSRNSPARKGKSSRALGSGNHDGSTAELDEATQERLGRLVACCADQLVRHRMPNVFLLLLAKMEAKERGE